MIERRSGWPRKGLNPKMWVQTQSCSPVFPQLHASAARLWGCCEGEGTVQSHCPLDSCLLYKQRVAWLLSLLILQLLLSKTMVSFIQVPQAKVGGQGFPAIYRQPGEGGTGLEPESHPRGHLCRKGPKPPGKGGGIGHRRRSLQRWHKQCLGSEVMKRLAG